MLLFLPFLYSFYSHSSPLLLFLSHSLLLLFLSFSPRLALSAILVPTLVRVVASLSPSVSFSLSSFLINVSFYFPLSSFSPRLYFALFACISFFLFSLSLSRESSSRSFHPPCSVSGPFVHPLPFQPVSFRLFARPLLSFVLAASSSLPLCCSLRPSLSFHSGLFSPLTRAGSPAARASEVFLNRSTTGGCYRAALFSSRAPKSLERRD